MCGNKFYQLSTCCTKDQRVEPFTFNHRRLPLPFLALQLAWLKHHGGVWMSGFKSDGYSLVDL